MDEAYFARMLRRFWSKVDKTDGCWEWTAATDKDGYGVLGVGRKLLKAHRISYMLAYDVTPEFDDMLVCHTCDNPLCVNPSHLFLGTNKDNVVDSVKKGRRYKALTPQQVREIRKSKARGVDLAEQYGVTPPTVCSIRNGYARVHD